MLGGGFLASYAFAKKSAQQSRYNQLYVGVAYAALAMALYWLFDFGRLNLQNIFGPPSYPWGRIVFSGAPLLVVVIPFIVAYISQYRANRSSLSTFTKATLVVSFIIYQIYVPVSGAYYVATGMATFAPNTSAWLIIGGYLVTPLVVAIVSFLLLNRIRQRFDRFFYAALIGTLYATLTIVLWEFRTDPSYSSTTVFDYIVTALGVFFVAVLLCRARKAAK